MTFTDFQDATRCQRADSAADSLSPPFRSRIMLQNNAGEMTAEIECEMRREMAAILLMMVTTCSKAGIELEDVAQEAIQLTGPQNGQRSDVPFDFRALEYANVDTVRMG